MNSTGTPVEPNWYPDPQHAMFVRYWDGARWTDDVRARPEEGPKTVSQYFEAFNAKTDLYNYLPQGSRKVLPPLGFIFSSAIAFAFWGLIVGMVVVGFFLLVGVPVWLLSFRENGRFWYTLKRQSIMTAIMVPAVAAGALIIAETTAYLW